MSFTSQSIPIESLKSSLLLGVVQYYSDIKKGRFAPSWDDFDLFKLAPPAVKFTSVIDVIAPTPTFRYRFWGTGLREIVGAEMTGKTVHENPDRDLAKILAAGYAKVVDAKAPRLFEEKLTSGGGSKFATLTLRLPLSDNNDDVDKIVSVTDFAEKMPDIKHAARNHFGYSTPY